MNIYKSKETCEIPEIDLLTLLFESPHTEATENTIVHLEANNPSVFYGKGEARFFTKRLAHTLRKSFGIGASGTGKDVVVVISSGQAFLPIAFYGVIAAGGVYSAASSAFTASELARQVKDGNSNLIICSKDVVKVAQEAARSCGVSPDRVLVLESDPIWRLYYADERDDQKHLVGVERLDWEKVTDKKTLQERPIVLLYSSGTTGTPKGVPLTNWNIVSAAIIPSEMLRKWKRKRLAEGYPAFEYRTVAHLPAAHIAGVQGYFVNPFVNGGLTAWMPKFDFPRFLHFTKAFRATTFFTVPPIYLLIAKSPLVTDQLKTLEFCISGAAPMGPELQRQASAKLGDGTSVYIGQTWGLSETTGSTTLMPFGERDETGSVSPLIANMEMRLVDDDGNDVKEGAEGEVLLKGPVVFRGYHNRTEATQESFKDGWFCTGDIGVVRNGLMYVVDRKKELIKYKGLQVAPAELEALLISHPDIADAAVIGVPWEGTEAPRAYVVANRKKMPEESIKEYVKSKASSHKQLRGGVVFIDAIPKSPSGKILRRELREIAKKETQAKL